MAHISGWPVQNGGKNMEVDAIRSKEEIAKMKEFCRQKGAEYELLFIIGINTALRIGDLLSLSVGNVVDESGDIVSVVYLKEKKTGKTKRCPVNESINKALTGYFSDNGRRVPAEPLFISRRGGALSRSQVWRVMKEAGKSVGLANIGTHSLRKTFGYQVYKQSGSDIGLVQKLLNHSSSAATLRYIGIDREKMDNICLQLNL